MQYKPPRKNIGPSQFATILEYSSFQTPGELKHELEEGSIREVCAAQTFGIEKEGAARKYYEKIRACKVIKSPWVRQGRILGKGDGMVGEDGGLEIKCHWGRSYPLNEVPLYYMTQIVGYLWLYKREWWDLMSCCYDKETGKISSHRIHRVYWKDWENVWNQTWLPRIESFINAVEWKE